MSDAKASINVRPGRLTDVPLVLQLVRELASYEKLADQVTATEDDIRESLFGERPQAEVLIAELDREAVGFALFFENYSTFRGKSGLYLEDLYVREQARGRGAGLALMKALAALAVKRGCPRMEWVVLDWNRPSIDFYDQIGARPLSDWLVYRLSGSELGEFARDA